MNQTCWSLLWIRLQLLAINPLELATVGWTVVPSPTLTGRKAVKSLPSTRYTIRKMLSVLKPRVFQRSLTVESLNTSLSKHLIMENQSKQMFTQQMSPVYWVILGGSATVGSASNTSVVNSGWFNPHFSINRFS